MSDMWYVGTCKFKEGQENVHKIMNICILVLESVSYKTKYTLTLTCIHLYVY